MTFTQKIKYDLINQNFTRKEFVDFIKGVSFCFLTNDGENYHIKIRNFELLKKIAETLKKFNFKGFEYDYKKLLLIKRKNSFLNCDFKENAHPWFYIAGLFVSRGSISPLLSNHYHLEIKLPQNSFQHILKFLTRKKLDFVALSKNNFVTLYLKKAEQISDFLKSINANVAMMEFEETRIQRDYNNNLNRISSLDFYNQEKISESNFELMDIIKQLEANNLIEKLSKNIQIFIEIKKNNPYESLQTIVEYLKVKNIVITKSGINHWIRKIKKISLQIKQHCINQ